MKNCQYIADQRTSKTDNHDDSLASVWFGGRAYLHVPDEVLSEVLFSRVGELASQQIGKVCVFADDTELHRAGLCVEGVPAHLVGADPNYCEFPGACQVVL